MVKTITPLPFFLLFCKTLTNNPTDRKKLKPPVEVTFRFTFATRVGKISKEVYLHVADIVHTSFDWEEWFPKGHWQSWLFCPETPGMLEAPSCTTHAWSASVTTSWLTAHIYLHLCVLWTPITPPGLPSSFQSVYFRFHKCHNQHKSYWNIYSECKRQHTVAWWQISWIHCMIIWSLSVKYTSLKQK